jgi:hypothetical protein
MKLGYGEGYRYAHSDPTGRTDVLSAGKTERKVYYQHEVADDETTSVTDDPDKTERNSLSSGPLDRS